MQMEDQIKAVDNFILNYQKAVLIYMTPDQVFCKHFKVSQLNLSFTQICSFIELVFSEISRLPTGKKCFGLFST